PLIHPSNVFALAFNPDGKTVVTCGSDPTVQIWDVETRRPIRHLTGHRGGVTTVAFSPCGRIILTGSQDMTARLWDAASGKMIGPPMRHPAPVARVAFGPYGRTILTSTEENVTRCWLMPDPITGSPVRIGRLVQVLTGMKLGPEDDSVRALDAIEWRKR